MGTYGTLAAGMTMVVIPGITSSTLRISVKCSEAANLLPPALNRAAHAHNPVHCSLDSRWCASAAMCSHRGEPGELRQNAKKRTGVAKETNSTPHHA